MTVSHKPMNDVALVKRYVYDLHESIGLLHAVGEFPLDDPRPTAWIIDHLREYHYLDIGDLAYVLNHTYPSLRDVDNRCGMLSYGCMKQLYRLFTPMAYEAAEAAFTDMRFHCNILTVQIYK